MYQLCKHPEYLQPLREELDATDEESMLGVSKQNAPLLDSFLKETARTIPLSMSQSHQRSIFEVRLTFGFKVTMDRKVMQPFTFSDGTHVPAGNVICVPEYSIMHDPANYRDPLAFDGFRFVDKSSTSAPTSRSRFSHPSATFPFWGSPRRSCPARFYVSAIAKLILSHIIKRFDFDLGDTSAKPYILWGPHFVPSPRMKIRLRRRREPSVIERYAQSRCEGPSHYTGAACK
ncbi:MAG: hypothetical protein Q9159_001029 [Coniocarpon cinnabarinum]